MRNMVGNLADIGTMGDGNIVNSTVIIINGGAFDPGKPRQPSSHRGDQRMPWSWWVRQSVRLLSEPGGAMVAARALLSMDASTRDACLRWLINDRGLTFETGMAGDEYAVAADPAARAKFDGGPFTKSAAPVPQMPDASWAARVPYHLAPIATLMCLDGAARQALIQRV
jgi:hypothetical protein